MIDNLLIGIITFFLFALLQAIIINGIYESMNEKMILSWIPKLIKKVIKNEYWQKPIFGCIKCMASLYGALTFWPLVLYLFGWYWQEIPIFIADVFTLVTLNWWIYKRL